MTETATIQEQVTQVLGGSIISRVQKLGASEQAELRAAFAEVPTPIYNIALNNLTHLDLIRRFSSRDGIVLLATPGATTKVLTAATKRYREIHRKAAYVRENRRYFGNLAQVQGREPTRYAKPVPLDDDNLLPPENHSDLPDAVSEEPHFGLSYEMTSRHHTYTEAETQNRLNSHFEEPDFEELPINSHRRREILRAMGHTQLNRVAEQIRTGQGKRNAKRAKARWLHSPEGRLWLKAKEVGIAKAIEG